MFGSLDIEKFQQPFSSHIIAAQLLLYQIIMSEEPLADSVSESTIQGRSGAVLSSDWGIIYIYIYVFPTAIDLLFCLAPPSEPIHFLS